MIRENKKRFNHQDLENRLPGNPSARALRFTLQPVTERACRQDEPGLRQAGTELFAAARKAAETGQPVPAIVQFSDDTVSDEERD